MKYYEQPETLKEIQKQLLPLSADYTPWFSDHLDLNFAISVEELPPIDKDLDPKLIQKVIRRANYAPFGWKDQTIVDTRVRNVWEIAAEDIKLNADFEDQFEATLKNISLTFGLDPKARLQASLHNLVLYEKGQFFSSHQDTEKTKDMVGTMIVVLPHAHRGGELALDHMGSKTTIPSENIDSSHCQIIAFYSDCYHEVKPVTDGIRIALTFNLSVSQSQLDPLPSSSPLIMDAIKEYFECAPYQKSRFPAVLAILLDHHYTASALNWNSLKGADRVRLSHLLSVAKDLELEPQLALADVHENWTVENEPYDPRYFSRRRYLQNDDEEDDRPDASDISESDLGELFDFDCQLKHWVGFSEQFDCQSLSVDLNSLTWTKSNSEHNPFELEYEGWMGNYGDTLDRWYHRAAIVLWRKKDSFAFRFLVNPNDYICREILERLSEDRKTALRRLKKALPFWSKVDLDADLLIGLANTINDHQASISILKTCDLSIVNSKRKSIINLFKKYGDDWALEVFTDWVKNYSSYEELEISRLSDFSSFPKTLNRVFEHQIAGAIAPLSRTESQGTELDIKNISTKQKKWALQLLDQSGKLELADQEEKILKELVNMPRVFDAWTVYPNLVSLESKTARDQLLQRCLKDFRKYTKEHANLDDYKIPLKPKCTSQDCAILTRFLFNPQEVSIRWPIAQQRRSHIRHQLDELAAGVRYQTERSGSPYKLILTKTNDYFAIRRKRALRAKNLLQEHSTTNRVTPKPLK